MVSKFKGYVGIFQSNEYSDRFLLRAYEEYESIDHVIEVVDKCYVLLYSISVVNPFTYKRRILERTESKNQIGFIFNKTFEQINEAIVGEYDLHCETLNIDRSSHDTVDVNNCLEVFYREKDKNRKPRLWIYGEYSLITKRLIESEYKYENKKNKSSSED